MTSTVHMAARPNLKWVYWLLPIVFLIHDLEEILMTPGWLVSNGQKLQDLTAGTPLAAVMAGAPTTYLGWTAAVAFLFLVICLVTNQAAREARPGLGHTLFLSILLVLFLHTFSHIGNSVLLGGYTPGVVTAPLVIPPYAAYAFINLHRAGRLTRRMLVWGLVGAVLLFPPVLYGAHALGSWIG